MKIATFLILLIVGPKVYSTEPEIEQVRALFEASERSKSAAERLLKVLSVVDQSAGATMIGYKGAAEMMQARYGLNPIHKFRSFNRGKKWIEQAVKKNPEDIEVRFLRFAMQTNLPSFLSYNEHIDVDKKFLLNNLHLTKDKELKHTISKYLLASKYCSEAEKKGISK